MGDAIGQMLASAAGIAISPLPLIAVVLMLATPRGKVNGTAFTLGWMLTLGLITAVVVLAGSGAGADDGGAPATWTFWLKLALGVLFLLMGVKQWRGRPKEGEEHRPPGWMRAIDTFTPGKSAGLAALLSGANPKNLVLAVGGAASIASSSASAGGKAVAGVLFVVIGSLCVLLPLLVYVFGGSKSERVLGSWKAWMAEHNAAIMTVVLVVLGAKYVGDAISGLTA
ncbi:GAP family protein [Streptomyces sp. SID14478]|uniref:GAP family protein n=1 Tax=Streptomyces sp. SID14478 TaxID=2706073 RepID=UPI0013DBE794|nr:GAP family protein [Streptomyces sp. SID14478]NEB76419.1 GAP family protein [Streptomyces sp. SID14478]